MDAPQALAPPVAAPPFNAHKKRLKTKDAYPSPNWQDLPLATFQNNPCKCSQFGSLFFATEVSKRRTHRHFHPIEGRKQRWSTPLSTTPQHDVAELCRKHGASILRRCRGILKDPAEAEDAAQEVYLMLLRKGDSFRGDALITTWLYRVTTNICLNRLRSKKRTSKREDNPDVIEWHSAPARNPLEFLTEKAQLQKILALLDPLNQQIFLCRYLDGLRQEEIAEVCQTSRKTVGKRLLQIRMLLENELQNKTKKNTAPLNRTVKGAI